MCLIIFCYSVKYANQSFMYVCNVHFFQVIMPDIFDNVIDEKEVEGIKGKLHEAMSTHGYDCFEIVAKFASLSSFRHIVTTLQKVSLFNTLCP